MKVGLVLGGGGLVGMAYHAGALKALDELRVDLDGFDVMVGTSAGSIMAAYLAAGWTPVDFYEYAFGRHPKAREDGRTPEDEIERIFMPLWSGAGERVRRGIGSFFALAAARGHWDRLARGRIPIAPLRKAFPAGLYSTEETSKRLYEDLPLRWPRSGLLISTVELYTGRRVAFGAPDAPEASLPEAVLASTAIPGVFPPVRIGGRSYVDGGAATATSLDLAVEAGCEAILCIAPLGWHNEGAFVLRDPKVWAPMLTRTLFARTLRDEVRSARQKGADVLVLRPSLEELKELGTNAMRNFDRGAMVERARAGVRRFLDTKKGHALLEVIGIESGAA